MALLWIEGFEGFGASGAPSGLARKYASVDISDMSIETGRTGGKAIEAGTAGPPRIQTPSLGDVATWIIGFGWRPGSAIGTAHRLVGLREPGDVDGVNLRVKTDGEFEVYRGTTLLGTTSGAAITGDTWAHLELKVVVANSGSFELRINGNTELSGSADTQAGSSAFANAARFTWNVNLTAGNETTFDDIYICDATGSANNDFLGNVKVVAFFPNAEGTTNDWTPSTGTDNSALVDENPANDDTDYVESDTSGHKDLYEYGNLGVDEITDIKGIQITATLRVTDATTFDVSQVVRSDVTESDGTAKTVSSTTYTDITRVVEQDPDTTAPWTEAGFNAAQFGVKLG